MQNITAHYNILYNANELLRQKQENYSLSFVDAYNQILSVYQDTTVHGTTPDKELEASIIKANNIINLKEQSHYIGDAYLVLGKANYLDGNFFNAVEFFNYVTRSFPDKSELLQEARVWKARSLMYLNQLPQAKLVLDTALQNINPKKSITADVYATKLQYDINTKNYADAEEMAKQAVHYSKITKQKLRWIFILAQLQELNHEPNESYNNYTKIVNSNAPFEMAFNANLNRIRIQDDRNGSKLSRIDNLRTLLKNQNNQEFIDQIYYQIAELYFAGNDIDNAIKNYKLSIRNSKKNQNQKGISYLRLADINFKNKADYVNAKMYYDSTLNTLLPNYPGYELIQKKNNNLQVLAERLRIIMNEDTLQSLAKLDEKTRLTRIDEIAKRQIKQQKATPAIVNTSSDPNAADPQASTPNGSNFYFYNFNAVSQGLNDFKRQWGNRQLEDNWRRSSRSNSDITVNTNNIPQTADPNAITKQSQKSPDEIMLDNYKQELLQNIPLSPSQTEQSNSRIYTAYLDIGNFYRDVLDDKKEAINTYEIILKRFPNDPNKAAVYYNLYRLYVESNEKAKSDTYKSQLLNNYANTSYAKIIIDPEYFRKLNDENAEFTQFYNQVYDLFSHKEYNKVISRADELLKQYPDNKFSAQLHYLKTIATGHQQKLPPFKDDLVKLADKYPKDRLITPLVNQHINYINSHQTEMSNRRFALMDNDPNEIPFIPKNTNNLVINNRKITDNNNTQINKTVITKNSKTTIKTQVINAGKNKTSVVTFSNRDSTNYYFVINVNQGNANLASSRFGIGQFNRTNFEDNTIKHQLLSVGDDNQLIYIGRFYSLKSVKAYATAIIPLMPEIMKVEKDKYSFFIITKENLDKLADKNLLDSYISYYQKNY